MDRVSQVEDILSDDEYEEGEILDEDILYENVSSLEEFSESESGGHDDTCRKDLRTTYSRGRTVERMRKKEHKCPKMSLCRNERSGKLCYARLRNRQANWVRNDGSPLDTGIKVDDDNKTGTRPRRCPQTRKGIDGQGRNNFNRTTPGNRRRYDKRRGRNFPIATRPRRPFVAVSDTPRRFSGSTTTSASPGFPRGGNLSNVIQIVPSAREAAVPATKSSLFDRLVGSGNIEAKPTSEMSVCFSEAVKEDVMINNEKAAGDVSRDGEEGDDEEELRLRLEALKTAVLRKHEGRKKKGATLSRKINSESDDDPVNEFALTTSLCAVESENVIRDSAGQLVDVKDDIKEDTGQVGSHIPVLNSMNSVPRPANTDTIRQKCLREIDGNKNNIVNKVIKLRRRRKTRRSMTKRKGTLKTIAGNLTVPALIEPATEDNDEDLLRQIALQSVKPRKIVSPGTLTQPSCALMTSLHVETDSMGKLSTNPSSAETWDDFDEDILRAQLLSSISSKMPPDSGETTEVTTVAATRVQKLTSRTVSFVKRVNKENARTFVKKNTSVNKMNVCRTIQPFIISLSQDSDSSDDECPPEAEDICASIDLLLQDARQKTEQEQALKKEIQESVKCDDVRIKKEKEDLSSVQPKKSIKATSTSTPVALRHLPVWQQEEYRQLKIKLAQKERLRDEAMRKCATKIVKTDPKLSALSNDSVAAPKAEPVQVSGDATVCPEDVTSPTAVESNSIQRSEGYILMSDDVLKTGSPVPPVQESAVSVTDLAASVTSDTAALSIAPQFKSSFISKELGEMSEMVVNFEKELNDYRLSKKEIGRLRRELALASNELNKKRRAILISKERLKNKEITLAAKIPPVNSPISPAVESSEQRIASRELEIINLKFREVKLRAQVACISMSNDIRTPVKATKSSAKDPLVNLPPKKRPKLPPKPIVRAVKAPAVSTNTKKVISVAESDALDPFTALCPFDLSGVCKDEECKFQHVRTS